MEDTHYELYHPVTEENAREFVAATAPNDATDEEKDQRVETLLRSAAENHSWRASRDPAERMSLERVPFASHPKDDSPEEETTSDSNANPDNRRSYWR